ncbi:gamma-glutamyl-gamma-aminobutyraldehyde dehydrogenase [Moraxella cuniculi DSM 21768]|uniref:Gamma-glutamyl-gamma-aminobutyraldehyde dehydrogenase n=1 Tax=Moraxella cuniculi DSM 21768 TaxID=1122245 RepID=A0A1N7EZG7_9GAMM|nr:aldehyde dehydrogenase [Moraxella cuniculi]OOS02283.1 gamma-glutamyl-gamma-aminobutyraldehyde dehydrogenase [Moraxella cuniculi]SIR93392.1 gamma-glutamyl-gamma-aminobutyraldehyde dehydrogenase [Moraxella cuniculi DSM 21768]
MTTPKNKEAVFSAAKQGVLYAGNLIVGADPCQSTMTNTTPIDNSAIGTIDDATEEHVNQAVKAARACFNNGTWKDKSPAQRKQIMQAWSALMKKHAEELAALDCIDAGKPISECINTDMPATLDTFDWYAEAIDKVFGKVAPTDGGVVSWIVKEPIGVVAAVLPWNFPAQMFAWKVAPALIMGNSVIVKPAELTSLSAYRMIELAYEAGVPKDALQMVCGRGEVVGAAIGRHMDIDMVSFTGSTEVGRLFLQYSAQSNLKEIVLECGGKSPQIVFEDAVIDEDMVNNVLSAAFWNMSENCSCGSRLLVHSSKKQLLLDKLVAGLAAWKLGDPRQDDVVLGPMIEQAHFDKVVHYLETAKSEGASLLTGGKVCADMGSGWYIEPTIFENVTADMTLFKEEVFGPILAVTAFDSEEEAVRLANDSSYGLAASFYTQNLKRALSVARQIQAGTVSINGFSEGDITTPFGGYKQSGFGGRDNGLEALEQYCQTKTIWAIC